MEVKEIVGYSTGEAAAALDLMESSMEMGQKARISICTDFLPTDDELTDLHLGMLMAGYEVTRPTAQLIRGIPTTEFALQKGSPEWQLIIPLLVPIFTIGLIAFGITKIEAISKALVPLVLITVGGLIILAVVARKPVERYLERGGAIPRLPATQKLGSVICGQCGKRFHSMSELNEHLKKDHPEAYTSVPKKALAAR